MSTMADKDSRWVEPMKLTAVAGSVLFLVIAPGVVAGLVRGG
jgi:hypothetical protein